jgi:hypothetical protein
VLSVIRDGLMNGNQLVRYGIALLPYSGLKRPAMDVRHDVHLALMFLEREPRGAVSKSPLPGLIIYGKTDKFDQRRALHALWPVLVVCVRGPEAGEIHLSECRHTAKQHHRDR